MQTSSISPQNRTKILSLQIRRDRIFVRFWGLILEVCILLWQFLIPFLEKTLKLKVKHKSRMFQPFKVLIINKLKHKNET